MRGPLFNYDNLHFAILFTQPNGALNTIKRIVSAGQPQTKEFTGSGLIHNHINGHKFTFIYQEINYSLSRHV
jgi:hypothetical protein